MINQEILTSAVGELVGERDGAEVGATVGFGVGDLEGCCKKEISYKYRTQQ